MVRVSKDSLWPSRLTRGKIRLSAGTYRVSAYGTDGAGTFGNAAPKARRVVRFTLTG